MRSSKRKEKLYSKGIVSIRYQQQSILTNIITKISFKKLHIVSMQQTVSNYTIHKLQVCNAIKYQKSWEEKVSTKIPEKYEILLHPLEFIISTLTYLPTYICSIKQWIQSRNCCSFFYSPQSIDTNNCTYFIVVSVLGSWNGLL